MARKTESNRRRALVGFWMIGGLLLSLGVPAIAQNSTSISQGFQTKESNIVPGALVSLEPKSQNTVQLANTDRVPQLVGVVADHSLIELSAATSQQVQVVISGTTSALVSNINGDIKSGDKITASPINGVGMKATESMLVIGTAQADLSSISTNEQAVTDKSGKVQSVRTGLLPVQVSITYYVAPDKKSFIPTFLYQIAQSIAGRDVSVARVLLSFLILLAGFVSASILLFSSVQSSIISIGRNPLSEGAVHKSMLEVGLTSIGILVAAIIAIYLVLRTSDGHTAIDSHYRLTGDDHCQHNQSYLVDMV